jgi:hypothetical protein
MITSNYRAITGIATVALVLYCSPEIPCVYAGKLRCLYARKLPWKRDFLSGWKACVLLTCASSTSIASRFSLHWRMKHMLLSPTSTSTKLCIAPTTSSTSTVQVIMYSTLVLVLTTCVAYSTVLLYRAAS